MANRLLDEAEQAAERGDYAAARQLARRARSGNPEEATEQRADQILEKTGIDPRTKLVALVCALAALAIFLYYALV